MFTVHCKPFQLATNNKNNSYIFIVYEISISPKVYKLGVISLHNLLCFYKAKTIYNGYFIDLKVTFVFFYFIYSPRKRKKKRSGGSITSMCGQLLHMLSDVKTDKNEDWELLENVGKQYRYE